MCDDGAVSDLARWIWHCLHLPREAENRLIDPTYVSIKTYSKNRTCL